MKLILLVIFNIIAIYSISSKVLNASDIFKGNKTQKLKINIKISLPKRTIIDDMKKTLGETKKKSYKTFSDITNKGSLFMACCVKGGLTSEKQILNAKEWALKNKDIRNDNELTIPINDLVKKISEQFKTIYHNDWKIKGPSKEGNYMVIDSERKIIFDSNGFRNHGQ